MVYAKTLRTKMGKEGAKNYIKAIEELPCDRMSFSVPSGQGVRCRWGSALIIETPRSEITWNLRLV